MIIFQLNSSRAKAKKFVKRFLTILLVFLWLFVGWPRIPYTNFPNIKEVKAAMPTFVNSGGITCNAGGFAPTMPASVLADDILLLFFETANQAITVSGGTETWTQVTNSPQGTGTAGNTSATRLTAFWARASQAAPTSPTSSDSGNHQCGVILAFRGVKTSGDPFNISAGNVDATGPATLTITGATTTALNTMVVLAVADDWDNASTTRYTSWTNSNLANLTERADGGDVVQNGGGLGIATGEWTSSGAYGNTTVAQNASILVNGFMSIALEGATATSTFTQNDFEWFVDAASVSLTDPWPSGSLDLSENTVFTQLPATNLPLKTGDLIRIQINVTVATATLSSGGQAFQLEYVASEDCTTAVGWSSVGASGGGTIWRFFDNASLTDGATEANQISTSDVAGDYVESNPTQTNPNSVTAGQDMEWDFAVENNGAAENTTYCFRMAKSGGTALDAYNSDSYPKLTTAPGAANILRHGNFFQNGSEKGFFWAN